uniref:Uncharacterized protein n=1 Tax=Candidatus Kentrum eta TaxID=2126337 RepID=A0A450VKI1_9GAMM|nr:MAG: hypothetical protein BECKH772A_GA0070896_102644 [Candidatus Kentron sp. H]VFK02581.1 MAG: hypothetical protein BECKH772B_GA0070898_102894 [Candidatus Kentron sp. H]VFK05309.1 MAG: hypothetical protein BECKH772C_GA0070978_102584 [Candidatus Kentron sp. H]
MAQSSITTEIHKTLDIHGYFTSQIPFDNVFCYLCPQSFQIRFH